MQSPRHLYDTQPSRSRARRNHRRANKEGQGMGAFLQYTVIGLTVGSFYALVALGYTIVYGIIRLINFAQGDLSMIGGSLPSPAAGFCCCVVARYCSGTGAAPKGKRLASSGPRRGWGIAAGAAVKNAPLAEAGCWQLPRAMVGVYYVQIQFALGFVLGL